MPIRSHGIPGRCLLTGALLLALSAATAHAQVQTGTVCESLEEREIGPVTDTASACQNHRIVTDPEDPSRAWEATSSAASRVQPGTWQVRASAGSENGVADALSYVTIESSLSVQSTDPSRQGEQVYVTFGAHHVDVRTDRDTTEPPAGDVDAASIASTRLEYSFFMFTLTSGATVDWTWKDEALAYDTSGTFNDSIRHEVTGELRSYVVPMMMGEGAWFRLSLGAYAHAQGTADALVDAFQSVYWGGITSVVDAAGRPVDYHVPVHGGTDWARSYVPGVAVPVPEPGSALLFASGVALLLGSRARGAAPRHSAGRG